MRKGTSWGKQDYSLGMRSYKCRALERKIEIQYKELTFWKMLDSL